MGKMGQLVACQSAQQATFSINGLSLGLEAMHRPYLHVHQLHVSALAWTSRRTSNFRDEVSHHIFTFKWKG